VAPHRDRVHGFVDRRHPAEGAARRVERKREIHPESETDSRS
jgi:hypothetical protein